MKGSSSRVRMRPEYLTEGRRQSRFSSPGATSVLDIFAAVSGI